MEEHFELHTEQGTIRGMAHIPAPMPATRSAVVIAHGYFSATRVGPARLYVHIARRLCESGCAAFRADLLGVGESDGFYKDITFDSAVRDLSRVCGFVADAYKMSSIVLLGHSMGANLAMRVAISKKMVRKLVLVAPDVEKRDGVDHLFDEEQLSELERRGCTCRKGLHINRSFVEEIRSRHPIIIAARVPCDIVVLQGDQDELYDMNGARQLAKAARGGKFVVIRGADHNFSDPSSRETLLREVVAEIVC